MGIHHFYNEGQVKLFFVSEGEGTFPLKVVAANATLRICWIQSSEGLSFLAYSGRIYRDAQGGLTLSTITLEVLANSLRTLTGEKNRSYYMASSNYVYIEIIERFQ